MDTPSMVMVKAEPAFQIKEEESESLRIEIKTEESEIFGDRASAMANIKNEHEIKMEKSEEMANVQSSSCYELKTEPCEEMDAEFEVLGAEAAEEVADKIVVMKRWMFCVPFKAVVEGTPFVPFKMPFDGSEVQPCSSKNSFRIADLMQAFPNIGLIIDLSNDRRTYRISDLSAFDVRYVNIPVRFERSSSVPDIQQLNQFLGTISMFLEMHPDKLIGVHDQLGNRATAYMICKALEQTGLTIKHAIKRFNDARGYPIYRALADVLYGHRRPWIPKSDFTPDVKRLDGRKTKKQLKAQRKANKQRTAEGSVNIQTKCEGKSKKQHKAERRAKKEQKAKRRAANHYKEFLASL